MKVVLAYDNELYSISIIEDIENDLIKPWEDPSQMFLF
jgi:hypothetical protein